MEQASKKKPSGPKRCNEASEYKPASTRDFPHAFSTATVTLSLFSSCRVCGQKLGVLGLVKCADCGWTFHFDCLHLAPPCIPEFKQPKTTRNAKHTLAEFCPEYKAPFRAMVPPFLVNCCAELEKPHRIRETRIYCAQVPIDERDEAWDKLERDPACDLSKCSTHAIANCVKKFLSGQTLTDSLIRSRDLSDFRDAVAASQEDDREERLRKLVLKMNVVHRDTLAFFMRHLTTVLECKQNGMSTGDLASEFAPLVGKDHTDPSLAEIMEGFLKVHRQFWDSLLLLRERT